MEDADGRLFQDKRTHQIGHFGCDGDRHHGTEGVAHQHGFSTDCSPEECDDIIRVVCYPISTRNAT
jgi:hypothetical protein